MTVEALLEQLKAEYRDAASWSLIYGLDAMDAEIYECDLDTAEHYQQKYDYYRNEVERLSMIIKEIEKRVS